MRGRQVRIRGAARRDAAPASSLLPEDRRNQGTVARLLGPQEHHAARRSRRFRLGRRCRVPQPAAERASRAELIERLEIKVAQRGAPDPATSRAATSRRSCWPSGSSRAPTSSSSTSRRTASTSAQGGDLPADERAGRRGQGRASSSPRSSPSSSAICNRVLVMREGRLVGELEGDDGHRGRADRALLCGLSGGVPVVARPNRRGG